MDYSRLVRDFIMTDPACSYAQSSLAIILDTSALSAHSALSTTDSLDVV